jgi:serine protease Do
MREGPPARWYDKLARIVALVAIGYALAWLVSSRGSSSDEVEVDRVASAPAADVRPTLAALPRPEILRHPALQEGASIPDVAEAVLPSVVSIINRAGRYQVGGGSGVIVREDGVILTNNHVVEGERDLRVHLQDGRELVGKVVGTDAKTDLAVIQLVGERPEGLVALQLGDSELLRIGEPVLAVGNPFGLSGTVTMGIVSALGRGNVAIVDYEDFIQTDAAINPGNSGGALVNTRGELVGINTAILSGSGGNQGVGLAIPTSLARPIMESLLETGKVERGWLGVYIQDTVATLIGVDGEEAPTRGVLVAELVAGGPGAGGGLRPKDVILSVGGKRVETSARLRTTVAHERAGEVVELELIRGGSVQRVLVELGHLPEDAPSRR